MTANVAAFLAMTSYSEGTDKAPDPYRVCYAFRHSIVSFDTHPAHGTDERPAEWNGELLPDHLCIAAGFSPGCKSTAAGKYQITRPTFLRLGGILRIRDFCPASQDAFAVQLLKEHGALDLINSGQVAAAIGKLHGEWASFPGGSSGQPQKRIASLIQSYTWNGGGFA